MLVATRSHQLLLAILSAGLAFGCEQEASREPASAPAKATAASSATTTAAPAPSPPPVPSAEEQPKLRDDCPEGSSGVGSYEAPCIGSGTSRMMEVKYTGKTTDEGPKFQVISKAKQPILHGSLVAYFYDKAGKQLQVTSGGKPRPKQGCSGNIFAGAVKPGEKIFVFFSCVKESDVPEGTAAIEAEVKTVGFADESGKKNAFYWKNDDLVPDERPKGGIKPLKKK